MGSTVSVILGLVLAVLVLVLFTVKLKIHPFFALDRHLRHLCHRGRHEHAGHAQRLYQRHGRHHR